MRAWQVSELGNPIDVLKLCDVEQIDNPASGHVQVSIKAVGIYFPDVLQCRGEYQIKPQLPWTPGGESAGVVTKIGKGVTDISPGDRVMMLERVNEHVNVQVLGYGESPITFHFEKAAAVPVNYGTTWFALHQRGDIQPGETLLVTGAAGGRFCCNPIG